MDLALCANSPSQRNVIDCLLTRACTVIVYILAPTLRAIVSIQ
jgi:hypothetical protein